MTTMEKKNSNDEEKTMSKRQFALSTAAAVASVVLSLGQPMDAQALSLKSSNKNGVYWIEPKNNATVTSPFTAKFGVKGYEVVPASAEFEEGTGHHHIIVDGEYMEKGTVVPFDATHLHYGKAQKEGEDYFRTWDAHVDVTVCQREARELREEVCVDDNRERRVIYRL
ncbi:unnamed protein product [Bathycoccus prasinos]